MHVRRQVRDAVVALLDPIPDFDVTANRLMFKSERPGVVVRTGSEREGGAERDSPTIQRRYDRLLALVIGIVVPGEEGSEDKADELAVLVEKAIAADPELGGLVIDVAYVGTDTSLEDIDGHPLADLTIEYSVWYRTTASDPETAI